MDTYAILPVLLSWAVHLSGYPAPDHPPEIVFAPHQFFVQHVCAGRECAAVGWYDDQDVVYLDEKYRLRASGFSESLIVHELVHFLQHQSGKFDSLSCEDSRTREREAYRVQTSYILQAQGRFELIVPPPTSCRYSESQTGRLAGGNTNSSESRRRQRTRQPALLSKLEK